MASEHLSGETHAKYAIGSVLYRPLFVCTDGQKNTGLYYIKFILINSEFIFPNFSNFLSEFLTEFLMFFRKRLVSGYNLLQLAVFHNKFIYSANKL